MPGSHPGPAFKRRQARLLWSPVFQREILLGVYSALESQNVDRHLHAGQLSQWVLEEHARAKPDTLNFLAGMLVGRSPKSRLWH